MKATWPGFAFTGQREALVLVPYPDGDEGKFSQGYGRYDVPEDNPPITPETALQWFIEDWEEREKQLDAMLPDVPLFPCMYDALMSCLYNAGSGLMRKSAVMPLLDERRYGDAAEALLSVKAGTPALFGRRKLERAMFINSEYGPVERVRLYRSRPVKGGPFEWMDFPKEGADGSRTTPSG